MFCRRSFLSYSPYVELFYKTVLRTGYPYENSDDLIDTTYAGNFTLADFGNHLITSLRDNMNGADFRKMIMDQTENSYRQFSSSVNYVDYLFKRHKRLLHIRVDLSIDRHYTPDDASSLSVILDYFYTFKKLMSRKEKPFDYLDGYIAHVEYGRQKGHHIHMSLFYYGQKKIKDGYIADQIREVWLHITGGIGLFQSTNLDKRVPICNALGIIEADDTDKIHCLYYVIWYLCKADQYLTYKHNNRQRLFFRGEIPKQKPIDE
jgi:hypothetical protein